MGRMTILSFFRRRKYLYADHKAVDAFERVAGGSLLSLFAGMSEANFRAADARSKIALPDRPPMARTGPVCSDRAQTRFFQTPQDPKDRHV